MKKFGSIYDVHIKLRYSILQTELRRSGHQLGTVKLSEPPRTAPRLLGGDGKTASVFSVEQCTAISRRGTVFGTRIYISI